MTDDSEKQPLNEYEYFLKNYGEEVPNQDVSKAFFDNQIKNMSEGIASIVGSSNKGTILDIGCGERI